MSQDEEFFDWGTRETREVPGFGVVRTPDLRGLGIDPHAMAGVFQPSRIGVMTGPEVIGAADAVHHPGYEGSDAQVARMILSHAPGLDREMPYEVPLTAEA